MRPATQREIASLLKAVEDYKKRHWKRCDNCGDLNEKNVCYNPKCSPVLLTKWRPKEKD